MKNQQEELVALSREGVQVYLTSSGQNGCLQIVLVDTPSPEEQPEFRKLGVTFAVTELRNLHAQIGAFLERETTRQRSERNSRDCNNPDSCSHATCA